MEASSGMALAAGARSGGAVIKGSDPMVLGGLMFLPLTLGGDAADMVVDHRLSERT